ncbi:MAG: O-acetylhomoserine aminocarboxypropyltransferase [SAR324 cluster bacterium]|nr:O-acetylhomoserine aminocarboxypropyltransferase [SAR324 cluster bacterium]
MVDPKFMKFDTCALHAGYRPEATTGARSVPIHQTASYVFRDTDHATSLFNLERAGHVDSRISNPTIAVLEERVSALEGGVGAVCTASGQAALHLGIVTLMGSGGHIVASSKLDGDTNHMFLQTLPRFGITVTLVDPSDHKAIKRAIRKSTRLVYGETLGNPGLEVFNIPAVAEIAHQADVPLMVDNTFATPYLCRPFEMGADIVVHSLTKFMAGHGIAIGGVLVDGGSFDWETAGKFPTLTEPYTGYHGLDFAEDFGPAAMICRARAEGLRDFGACLSPMNAFYILQGIETLSVRMARHTTNAQSIAEFLKEHPSVDSVVYPGLSSHSDYELAKKQLTKGCGAVLSLGIKGGYEAVRIFIENLNVFSHLANVGDAKSLVIHPASTTHQQMSKESLKQAGIRKEMVRLSVGLEDLDDLINDLKQALRMSQQ